MRLKLLKTIAVTSVVLLGLTACGNKQENVVGKEEVVVEADNDAVAVEENTAEEEKEEVVEIDIKAFANQIMEERTDIDLVEMTEGYVSGVMNFDLTKISEYVVCVDASGSTVDEFGIFKTAEGASEEVEQMLAEYLETRVDTWMDEYMPEEKPKVENAQIRNSGNYYVYAILGDSEKELFLNKFDEATSK